MVEQGESFEITRHGKPVAYLVNKDEKTIKKFYKGLKLSTKLQSIFPNMGRKIVAKLFKDVREKVYTRDIYSRD